MRTRSGSPGEVGRAQAQLASVLIMGQRNEPALAELERALAAIRDVGADASGVELASQLARARMVVGDDQSSLEWAERALADAERLGLDALAVDLLVTRGTARHRLGDEEAGLADLQRATARAQEAGFLNTELRARNNLAWLLVGDDPRATMETARQGFELATTMGVHDMGMQLASVAVAAAVDTGDWDWALATAAELEERGISEAFRIDFSSLVATIRTLRGAPRPLEALDELEPRDAETDPQILAGVLNARAWEAFVSGRFDEAHALAVEGAAGQFGADKGYQLALATRASLWLGDLPTAEATLRAHHEIGITGRAMRAASATLVSGVAALSGDRSAAAQYRTAAEAWRELELPFQLALCLVDEHHLVDGGTGSPDDAEMVGLLRTLGADGLARLAGAETGAVLSPRSAPARPARSPRPTVRTASRSGGARRRRRATDPPAPRG
jgi:tetratricopeptide (TPR) repeat protein